MKKSILSILGSVFLIGLIASCSSPHIPLKKATLPEGVYVQSKSNHSSGYGTKLLDGVETYESIDVCKEIITLTIKSDKKIQISKKYVTYYSIDNTGDIPAYTTLAVPEEEIIYNHEGTYQIYTDDNVVFDLDDVDEGGPLQEGCYWLYTISGDELTLKKNVIMIDGTIVYNFIKQ